MGGLWAGPLTARAARAGAEAPAAGALAQPHQHLPALPPGAMARQEGCKDSMPDRHDQVAALLMAGRMTNPGCQRVEGLRPNPHHSPVQEMFWVEGLR